MTEAITNIWWKKCSTDLLFWLLSCLGANLRQPWAITCLYTESESRSLPFLTKAQDCSKTRPVVVHSPPFIHLMDRLWSWDRSKEKNLWIKRKPIIYLKENNCIWNNVQTLTICLNPSFKSHPEEKNATTIFMNKYALAYNIGHCHLDHCPQDLDQTCNGLNLQTMLTWYTLQCLCFTFWEANISILHLMSTNDGRDNMFIMMSCPVIRVLLSDFFSSSWM